MKYIWSWIKHNLAAGLLVVVPFLATVWLLAMLWLFIDRPLNRFFLLFKNPDDPTASAWLRTTAAWCKTNVADIGFLADIPGTAALITLAAIILIGFITRTLVGRILVGVGERIVERVPILGKIYGGVKQILEAIFSKSDSAFREAVLIEYPRKGLWSIAFLTHSVPSTLCGTATPRPSAPATDATGASTPPAAPDLPAPLKAVEEATPFADTMFAFVPTTPNPTSGVLVAVRRCDMRPLDMSVDEAIKLVISAGMVQPKKTDSVQIEAKHFL